MDKTNTFKVSHTNLRAYYNFTPSVKKVFANTAALMMIRKNTFMRCGMFNEKYETCLEDVELNLKCICLSYENYYDGSLVSYHFRSQTRGNDINSYNMEKKDLEDNLFPFVKNNIQKLGKYILVQN
jgi:GT2 family glycosyltransferase